MRPTASDTFRTTPHYARDAFRQGLARCGFEVGAVPKSHPEPCDILLIWNRSRYDIDIAKNYEARGARVIVAENGYFGFDASGNQQYAIALSHHNGAGKWTVGPDDRWSRLGIETYPWRRSGTEIVVLAQRGIGEPGLAQTKTWPDEVASRLRAITDRPIRIRRHPGKARTDPRNDLGNAWAAVTWASGAGIKAIAYGVPVFHEMPSWIGAPAARFGIENIEEPFLGDRIPMFRRLAWAMWNLQEIRSGEPFQWLLQ